MTEQRIGTAGLRADYGSLKSLGLFDEYERNELTHGLVTPVYHALSDENYFGFPQEVRDTYEAFRATRGVRWGEIIFRMAKFLNQPFSSVNGCMFSTELLYGDAVKNEFGLLMRARDPRSGEELALISQRADEQAVVVCTRTTIFTVAGIIGIAETDSLRS